MGTGGAALKSPGSVLTATQLLLASRFAVSYSLFAELSAPAVASFAALLSLHSGVGLEILFSEELLSETFEICIDE